MNMLGIMQTDNFKNHLEVAPDTYQGFYNEKDFQQNN